MAITSAPAGVAMGLPTALVVTLMGTTEYAVSA